MANRRVLYQTVYRHLKQQIESGQLQAGEKLATEREIMETFGVSRVTTTRALQLLQSEKLIVRQPGRGSYVAQEDESDLRADPMQSQGSASDAVVIGFVAPFLQYSFGPSILATMEEEVNRKHGVLAVMCSYGSQAKEEDAIKRLLDVGVKGLVVFPVNGEYYNPVILQLHLQGFPLVLVDKFLPGIPLSHVTTNNRQAAQLLTQELVDLGHRHIGYFSPKLDGTSTLSERHEGFLAALNDAGIPFLAEYFIEPIGWVSPMGSQDARQIQELEDWLDRNPQITAVFASDDQLAQCLLAAVRHKGLEVPQDFSIVCFDGPPSNALFWAFTSALQDEHALARHATRIVFAKLQTGSEQETAAVEVPAKIHRGQSTATVPTSRPLACSPGNNILDEEA